MRNIAVAGIALACIALVTFLASTVPSVASVAATGRDSGLLESGSDVDVDAVALESDSGTLRAAADTRDGGQREVRTTSTVTDVDDGQAWVVRGIVQDELGIPLSGARVQLAAQRAWNDTGDGESFATFGAWAWQRLRGFETTTQASGDFVLRVPPSDASEVRFSNLPDRFHDAYSARFSGSRNGALPPLAGAVMSEAGQALSEASVWIEDENGAMIGRRTTADRAGQYALAFVEPRDTRLLLHGMTPGTYEVDVHASLVGAPKTSGKNRDGSTWFGPERLFTRTATVTLRDGAWGTMDL